MRVIKKLAQQFNEPKDAEAHYFPVNVCITQEPTFVPSPAHRAQVVIEQVPNQGQQVVENRFVRDRCRQLLVQLPLDDQLKAISTLFVQYAHSDGITELEDDFLTLCIAAMHHLRRSGRSNVLRNLV